jgi:hypothetical protein
VKLALGFKKNVNFAAGEVAEWSIAAVLKTVEGKTSGGSNPSFSAQRDLLNKKGLSPFIFNAKSPDKQVISAITEIIFVVRNTFAGNCNQQSN